MLFKHTGSEKGGWRILHLLRIERRRLVRDQGLPGGDGHRRPAATNHRHGTCQPDPTNQYDRDLALSSVWKS